MSSEDEPRSDSAINAFEVVPESYVLFAALPEVVLSAHHHKVDLSIAETKPVVNGNTIMILVPDTNTHSLTRVHQRQV